MFSFVHRLYQLADVSGNIVAFQGDGVESESFTLQSKHFKVNTYMEKQFQEFHQGVFCLFNLSQVVQAKLISSPCFLAELSLLNEVEAWDKSHETSIMSYFPKVLLCAAGQLGDQIINGHLNQN